MSLTLIPRQIKFIGVPQMALTFSAPKLITSTLHLDAYQAINLILPKTIIGVLPPLTFTNTSAFIPWQITNIFSRLHNPSLQSFKLDHPHLKLAMSQPSKGIPVINHQSLDLINFLPPPTWTSPMVMLLLKGGGGQNCPYCCQSENSLHLCASTQCQSPTIISTLQQLRLMTGTLPTTMYTDFDPKLFSSPILSFCLYQNCIVIAAPSEQQNQNGFVECTW